MQAAVSPPSSSGVGPSLQQQAQSPPPAQPSNGPSPAAIAHVTQHFATTPAVHRPADLNMAQIALSKSKLTPPEANSLSPQSPAFPQSVGTVDTHAAIDTLSPYHHATSQPTQLATEYVNVGGGTRMVPRTLNMDLDPNSYPPSPVTPMSGQSSQGASTPGSATAVRSNNYFTATPTPSALPSVQRHHPYAHPAHPVRSNSQLSAASTASQTAALSAMSYLGTNPSASASEIGLGSPTSSLQPGQQHSQPIAPPQRVHSAPAHVASSAASSAAPTPLPSHPEHDHSAEEGSKTHLSTAWNAVASAPPAPISLITPVSDGIMLDARSEAPSAYFDAHAQYQHSAPPSITSIAPTPTSASFPTPQPAPPPAASYLGYGAPETQQASDPVKIVDVETVAAAIALLRNRLPIVEAALSASPSEPGNDEEEIWKGVESAFNELQRLMSARKATRRSLKSRSGTIKASAAAAARVYAMDLESSANPEVRTAPQFLNTPPPLLHSQSSPDGVPTLAAQANAQRVAQIQAIQQVAQAQANAQAAQRQQAAALDQMQQMEAAQSRARAEEQQRLQAEAAENQARADAEAASQAEQAAREQEQYQAALAHQQALQQQQQQQEEAYRQAQAHEQARQHMIEAAHAQAQAAHNASQAQNQLLQQQHQQQQQMMQQQQQQQLALQQVQSPQVPLPSYVPSNGLDDSATSTPHPPPPPPPTAIPSHLNLNTSVPPAAPAKVSPTSRTGSPFTGNGSGSSSLANSTIYAYDAAGDSSMGAALLGSSVASAAFSVNPDSAQAMSAFPNIDSTTGRPIWNDAATHAALVTAATDVVTAGLNASAGITSPPTANAVLTARPSRSRAASGSVVTASGSRSRAASGSGYQSLLETRSRAASSASSAWGGPIEREDDVEELKEDDEFEDELEDEMQEARQTKKLGPGAIVPGVDEDLQKRMDPVFVTFLADLCSNLEATDAKGEPIHQTLMAKKMEKLDQSTNFRPFKFRIQAFTSAFTERLVESGFDESQVPIKKVRQYLWASPFISRFNDDGRKAKSKGNHIWTVEAKKLPDRKWAFREFTRCIKGQHTSIAYVGVPWSWSPRVWDPQASIPQDEVTFRIVGQCPAWLHWEEQTLTGVAPEAAAGDAIDIIVAASLSDGSPELQARASFRVVLPESIPDANGFPDLPALSMDNLGLGDSSSMASPVEPQHRAQSRHSSFSEAHKPPSMTTSAMIDVQLAQQLLPSLMVNQGHAPLPTIVPGQEMNGAPSLSLPPTSGVDPSSTIFINPVSATTSMHLDGADAFESQASLHQHYAALNQDQLMYEQANPAADALSFAPPPDLVQSALQQAALQSTGLSVHSSSNASVCPTPLSENSGLGTPSGSFLGEVNGQLGNFNLSSQPPAPQ
ncbi:hypothetical protein ACM66B_004978 [Microbotryomycetes sp. NB124-2]